MPFYPTPINSFDEIEVWFRDQMDAFERYLKAEMRIREYTAAPINPEEGDVVRADGTLWNPGSGAGFYGYHAGTWKFLG